MDPLTRYSSDREQMIKLLRELGWSDEQIVREITWGCVMADVR